eukprot:3388506-Amphidinium_carterae.1
MVACFGVALMSRDKCAYYLISTGFISGAGSPTGKERLEVPDSLCQRQRVVESDSLIIHNPFMPLVSSTIQGPGIRSTSA